MGIQDICNFALSTQLSLRQDSLSPIRKDALMDKGEPCVGVALAVSEVCCSIDENADRLI